MSVGEKHSVLQGWGRGRGREGKKSRDIGESGENPEPTCSDSLPWNWQEGIISFRIIFFFTFPGKINWVWTTFKPLKNWCLCEFTATWDGKELPGGLRSVPCNSDVYSRFPGLKSPQAILACAPASPCPQTLSCLALLHQKHGAWGETRYTSSVQEGSWRSWRKRWEGIANRVIK